MARYTYGAAINILMTSSMLHLVGRASYDKSRGELIGFGTNQPH
jgi:hypothetical protein